MYSTKANSQITYNNVNIIIFFFFLIWIKVIQQSHKGLIHWPWKQCPGKETFWKEVSNKQHLPTGNQTKLTQVQHASARLRCCLCAPECQDRSFVPVSVEETPKTNSLRRKYRTDSIPINSSPTGLILLFLMAAQRGAPKAGMAWSSPSQCQGHGTAPPMLGMRRRGSEEMGRLEVQGQAPRVPLSLPSLSFSFPVL